MRMANILEILTVFFEDFHKIIPSFKFRRCSEKAHQVAIQPLL